MTDTDRTLTVKQELLRALRRGRMYAALYTPPDEDYRRSMRIVKNDRKAIDRAISLVSAMKDQGLAKGQV